MIWHEVMYEDTDDFYSDDMIEELNNSDAITPAEEGFMIGWLDNDWDEQ